MVVSLKVKQETEYLIFWIYSQMLCCRVLVILSMFWWNFYYFYIYTGILANHCALLQL